MIAFKLIVAVLAAFLILRIGWFVLRAVGSPAPKVPPGQMRKTNLRYRCTVCGAEVRMTSAADEMPEAPRHCMDEMQLITGPED